MAGIVVVILNLAAVAAYVVAARAFMRGYRSGTPAANSDADRELASILRRQARELAMGAAWAAAATALEGASLLAILLISVFQ